MNALVTDICVHTQSLTRAFGTTEILKDVELRIPRGQFVALLGRSGSGKSTLLRLLAGLDTEFGGRLFVPPQRAVVFQDARLVPWKRVLANITLGLHSDEERDLARDLMKEVGLQDRERAWPATLSGGEGQRVALARALARRPQLLLLDEPFGALDALTRLKMHEILINLWRRYRPSILLVTHDVDEAVLLADRVLVLTDGCISLDIDNEAPHPRSRSQPQALALRERLLSELGVKESL